MLVHARALLTSTPEGSTAYIDADLRDPDSILSSDELAALDLSKPVALTLMATLHFVTDNDAVHRILGRLMAPLASGSALALSVTTTDSAPEEVERGHASLRAQGIEVRPRNRAEVDEMFRGLRLLDPGVVLVHRWHPDDEARALPDAHVHLYGGVALKP